MTRDIIDINDFTVFLEYASPITEEIDKCAFDEDCISFCFYGSGNVELTVQYGDKEKTYANTKGFSMAFFANANTNFIHKVSKERPLQCLLVYFSLAKLKDLPEQENELYGQYLKELIAPNADYVEGPSFYMSHDMQQAVDKVFSNTYEGAMGKLFLRSQVTELMAHFFGKLSNTEEPQQGIKNEDREKLYEVRNILAEKMDAPPSLSELSRLVGLNDYKLKKSFKELFGFPVYKYLQNERLIKAHDLLSKPDASVQEVAWTVGYESLSSFSNAFAKKYGFRPSEIRG